MEKISIREKIDEGLLYLYYGISVFAVFTLIIYFSMFLVNRSVAIPFASIFCMNGLLWCGWMLRKYKNEKLEYKVDRYLWLGVSCGLLYVCLQILDSGLWLWIPAIAFVIFYILFVIDELKIMLNWKKNVKIVW